MNVLVDIKIGQLVKEQVRNPCKVGESWKIHLYTRVMRAEWYKGRRVRQSSQGPSGSRRQLRGKGMHQGKKEGL